VAFAQDELDDESSSTTFKAPKRPKVVDKNPTINVQGIVVDNATKAPIAGVRLKTLNDERYAAMTDADGKFTIKVPTFATALYVQAPKYMSQQVSIIAGDANQEVRISMLSDAFSPMYQDGTTITATNGFTSNGNGLTIDEEMTAKLGGDIRMNMHSGNLEQGAAMFIRGISSINANAQPLIILDGVELDMQQNRPSLHLGDIFNMLSTISPEDIDKVTVLKNATAIYGARGANGVILIDT
jgi:TonB-dependent SusC/RagA subfamily outer membrane receptor